MEVLQYYRRYKIFPSNYEKRKAEHSSITVEEDISPTASFLGLDNDTEIDTCLIRSETTEYVNLSGLAMIQDNIGESDIESEPGLPKSVDRLDSISEDTGNYVQRSITRLKAIGRVTKHQPKRLAKKQPTGRMTERRSYTSQTAGISTEELW
jgi:hypothetical protein